MKAIDLSDLPEGSIPVAERRTVAEIWESYAAEVLPADANPVQLMETRRAFYAGIQAMLSVMMGGFDDTSDATRRDVEYLQSIAADLRKFCDRVLRGEA